jgi:hypothetical protein
VHPGYLEAFVHKYAYIYIMQLLVYAYIYVHNYTYFKHIFHGKYVRQFFFHLYTYTYIYEDWGVIRLVGILSA